MTRVQNRSVFRVTMIIAAVVLGMETGGFQYIVLKVAESYDLSQTAMGTLVSVHFIAVIIIPPIFGLISDRVGKRKVTTLFCAVFLGGAAICCCSSSVTGFSIGIFCAGAAFGTLLTTCQAALSDAYPGESGKVVSRFQGATGVGCVISPLLISFGMENLHCTWRLMFLICGVGFLVVLILLPFCWYPEMKIEERQWEQKAEGGFRYTFLTIVSRVLIGVLVGIFFYMFMETSFAYFLDSYFVNVLSSAEMSSAALSLFWAMIAGTRLLIGRVYPYYRLVLPVSMAISTVMILLIGTVQQPLAAVFLSGIAGIAFAPVWPFLLGRVLDRYPDKTGLVTGLVMLMDGAGASAAPVVTGLISDMAGLRMAFNMLISLVGIILLLSYVIFLRR